MFKLIRPLLLGIGLSSLLLSLSATGQTRTSHSKRVAQPPIAVAQAITGQELAALLKPEGPEGARPLLVNYWATWCDPCREEFPDLVKIDKDYRNKGLHSIAISLDDFDELKTGVPKFLRAMKVRMPVYLLNESDSSPSITAVDPAWSGALPATFLYNAKGEIVFKHFGRFNTTELRAAIQKVLSE